ncbi:uncharacterized protein [Primulina eburnea]|uniref:uncharacterized protein n=1 Tax=Primulina eburnea TaxID=1245227 RepID=UPI003C6C5736
MKGSGFISMFLLLVVIGTAAFGYASKGSTSSNSGVTWMSNEKAVASPFKFRKLKDEMDPWVSNDASEINLEDYRRIDPVPSSKASIRPGPVQHGTPLMPYIPKPEPSPPPSQLKHGGHP